MMNHWDQEVEYLTGDWSPKQMDDYIVALEARILVIKKQITLLKQIRRKRAKRKPQDNGPRAGGA